MPAGRPSLYSEAVALEICQRLLRGEPLARICDDDSMPSYATVRSWEDANPEFLALSTRARKDGTHYLADDCLRIADDMKLDPAHKRIMIDTRLRLIGKWNAKAYGDKIEIEQKTEVSHSFNWDNLDSDEASTLVALMKKAAAGVDRGKANGAGKPNGRVH